jgi:hypothetical protein
VTLYALSDANRALKDLRTGRLNGAAVLIPESNGTAISVDAAS